jgi:hypothetical protein
MNRSILLSGGIILLAACNPAPLKNGTVILGTSQAETVTKSYKNVEGALTERIGNKGFGDNCTEASEATSLVTTTSTLTRSHSWEVVGDSHTDQPLDPEEGREGRTAVSVIAEEIVSRGDVFTEATAYGAGPEGENVNSLDQTPDVAVTASRYFGLAGDDYNADKIGVYIVAESDPEVANIIDDCLYTSNYQDVSNPGVEEDNIVSTSVLLDPGCDGQFMHQQVGTQWWFKDTMLKSEGTRWDVSIDAHGYEWFIQDGDTCSRFTGNVAPEATTSKLFVQYSVTRTVETYQVDSIGEVAEGGQ